MNDYAEHNLVNQLYFNKKIIKKKNKILRTFLKLLKKKNPCAHGAYTLVQVRDK